jgi:hypothetical protein
MKKTLRWLASLLPLRRQVRLITWILPSHYWYRAGLAMSRWQGNLIGLLGGNRVLTEAVMLDHWLSELTAIGPFPVPYVVNGGDNFRSVDPKIGTVYCWIHEPLVEFAMRSFLDLANPEAMVVADRGRIVDGGRYMVVGLKNRMMAIPADRYALGRAKRALMEGTSVVCLADEYMGGPLLPYVLQLAGRIKARVVFQWSKRRPDGTIEVTVINAPRSYCETPDAVHENLAFLRAAQKKALAELGLADTQIT